MTSMTTEGVKANNVIVLPKILQSPVYQRKKGSYHGKIWGFYVYGYEPFMNINVKPI